MLISWSRLCFPQVCDQQLNLLSLLSVNLAVVVMNILATGSRYWPPGDVSSCHRAYGSSIRGCKETCVRTDYLPAPSVMGAVWAC